MGSQPTSPTTAKEEGVTIGAEKNAELKGRVPTRAEIKAENQAEPETGSEGGEMRKSAVMFHLHILETQSVEAMHLSSVPCLISMHLRALSFVSSACI